MVYWDTVPLWRGRSLRTAHVTQEYPLPIISPVAGDYYDSTVGVIEGINRKTEHIFANTYTGIPHLKEKILPEPTNGTPPLRLMTRVRHTPEGMSTNTPVGLAIALYNEERNVETVSSDELRTAQAADETCQRLLLQTSKATMYELKKEFVRVSPVDGSQQEVVPQSLVSRILYM
jgi:hypothetical protein